MKKIITMIMLLVFTSTMFLSCGETEAEKAKKEEDQLNLIFLLLLLNSRSTTSTTSNSSTSCFFAGTSGGCPSGTPYTCNASSFCSSSSTCSNLTACTRSTVSSDVKLSGDGEVNLLSLPKQISKSSPENQEK
ncbi:hypothetical protein [Leptospira ryugenii]|uniref:hypothetical protein n=1 Tax=Leptospira ryugenii TaxID=1917863 RepID=UPI00107FA818|nr:hypothetical protein [Leptospira ryugenii]